MKNQALLAAILSAALVATGSATGRAASETLENAKTKTEDAARDAKDYAFSEKDAFARTMKHQLAEIDRKLDQLDAKIQKAGESTRAEAKPKMRALREKAGKLDKQLDAVKNATASTWDSVKTDSKHAFDDLKDGVNDARQWVSEKIAP